MSLQKKKLLWFVSTTEDTKFLKAFSEHFDGTIDVVHLNFLTRLDLIGFNGRHFLPLSKYSNSKTVVDVSKTFNVLSGRLSEKLALLAYQSTAGMLVKNLESFGDSIFVIPSGRHVHHVAATDFALAHSIKRIYINYSNFPGYTFFDPEGTDCLASIYRDPTILDKLYPQNVDVEAVFKKFSAIKRNQKSIPQASGSKIKSYVKSTAFIVDSFIQKLVGFVGDRRVSFGINIQNDVPDINYDSVSLDSKFVFFPMQVSTDQQVLVNYDGGSVISALKEALEIARKNNALLYVREHPAEAQKIYIRSELNRLRQESNDIKVVSNPVAELIEHAHAVVTINSTVGLECRLNYKDVVFLGKSFYSNATDVQLAKYLCGYLLAIDYHEPAVDESLISDFLKRVVCE